MPGIEEGIHHRCCPECDRDTECCDDQPIGLRLDYEPDGEDASEDEQREEHETPAELARVGVPQTGLQDSQQPGEPGSSCAVARAQRPVARISRSIAASSAFASVICVRIAAVGGASVPVRAPEMPPQFANPANR